MKNLKVSAVIPTFNGLELLKKNLPAVLRSLRDGDELVIVDDASNDDSVSYLKREFKAKATDKSVIGTEKLVGGFKAASKTITVVILINKKNQRFGESSNRGVKAATGDLIFLINNDVSPKKDVLKHLLMHFQPINYLENKQIKIHQQSKIFAVGCMEIEKLDGKKIYGGKNKLWFEKGLFIHSRADKYTSGKTAWASGGSAMFDRKKWLELEGFDKIYYPAYWEDIDLSFRAKKKGWQVLFEEKAVVNHNHESTNIDVFGQKKLNLMSWRNADKFTMKNGNLWQKVSHLLWKPYWWWKRKVV